MTVSLRTKLILLVLAAIAGAVIVSTAMFVVRESTQHARATQERLTATADVFASTVAKSLETGDRARVLRTLRAIAKIPGVTFAEVHDANGHRFAEIGNGVGIVRSTTVLQGNQQSIGDTIFSRFIEVHVDIVSAGRVIGTLRLLADNSELWARLRNGLMNTLIGAAVAIFVGTAIALWLQRSIIGPIKALTRAMAKIRQTHDFRETVSLHGDTETKELVAAFNDMMDQIRNRDERLERHREHLEIEVEERTEDYRNAKDEAESANRAKSDFLATMSHEIRTPMNGMLVMAELLAGADLPARQQHYSEVIVNSGQSLLRIINDILDFSKVESGKLELEAIPVDVDAILKDVATLFGEQASGKKLDLVTFVDPAVPQEIIGDPVRLNQILSNLVNNALKFTEEGHVSISVEQQVAEHAQQSEHLLFVVEDTGVGIPSDKIDTIFGAFNQADQSTTRQYGGTGLGLAICERLVLAMGGKIWAESEPGKGTRFCFHLPCESTAPEPKQQLAASGRLVLVDSSSPVLDRALATYLRACGFRIMSGSLADIASGNQMADLVFASPSDLIGCSGRIREQDDLTVVCVARFGDVNIDRVFRMNVADGILPLPFSRGDIYRLAKRYCAGEPLAKPDDNEKRAVDMIADFGGHTVLVADDSPVNREVVTEALKRLNINANVVENGADAVSASENGDYALILMDCSMPVMDGFQASRAIRQNEVKTNAPRLPIIALTAHVAGMTAESWQDAGMDACVTKPFTIKSLSNAIARFVTPVSTNALSTLKNVPHDSSRDAAGSTENEPEASSDKTVFDPDTLRALREMQASADDDILNRIFSIFLSHGPRIYDDLESALNANDLDALAKAAHALKSTSYNVGAKRLAEFCGRLEDAARHGERTSLTVLFRSVSDELKHALGEADAYAMKGLNRAGAATM